MGASIDPDPLSHNALADLGLYSLLGIISRTNSIDSDLPVHYVTADQGLCCLHMITCYELFCFVFVCFRNPGTLL